MNTHYTGARVLPPNPEAKGRSLAMAYLDLQDVRIHYEFEQNHPRTDVLVFCNSLGANLSMWLHQVEALRGKFSILRYDGRGHGASSVPAYPYTVEQLGGDVLALLDGLGLQKIHFCGLSLGGVVGQWLGVHAPHRVQRLVLCNTAAKIGSQASWNERIETVRRDGMVAIVPAALERWYTPRFRREAPAEVAKSGAMLLSTDPAGYVANCAALRDMDQREAVKRIQVPTLVVFGKEDPVTTPADAHYLLQSIAGAKPLALDAAHLSNIEAPSQFSAGLTDFLLDQGIS